MKKIEQIHLRLPSELKQLMAANAKKQNLTSSEYIRTLIEKDKKLLTHEQRTQNALAENQFVNELLKNPEITNKCKQTIGKELKKYVNNKN